jgi:amphi-Trp domain-containing protein
MAKEKEKDERAFQHESLQDPQAIASYLEALRDGFASGRLTFSDKNGELTLEPHGLVGFELRVSHKRDRIRLTVRFNWQDGTAGEPLDARALTIRAGDD